MAIDLGDYEKGKPYKGDYDAELARLQERWGTSRYLDPHFSPLFSRTSEQCLLAL